MKQIFRGSEYGAGAILLRGGTRTFPINIFKVSHFCIYKLFYYFHNCVIHLKKKLVCATIIL